MVVSSEITFRLRLSWSLVACLPGRRASLILVVVESNSSGCFEMINLCNGRKQEASGRLGLVLASVRSIRINNQSNHTVNPRMASTTDTNNLFQTDEQHNK